MFVASSRIDHGANLDEQNRRCLTRQPRITATSAMQLAYTSLTCSPLDGVVIEYLETFFFFFFFWVTG